MNWIEKATYAVVRGLISTAKSDAAETLHPLPPIADDEPVDLPVAGE